MVSTTTAQVIARTGEGAFDIALVERCMPTGTSIVRDPGVGIRFCEIHDLRRGTKLFLSARPQPHQEGFELEVKLGDLKFEYHTNGWHHFATVNPPLIRKVVYHLDPRGGFMDFCCDKDASEETFGLGQKRRVRVLGGFFVAW